MLVLTTRINDKIHIGDKLTIKIISYSKGTADLLVNVETKKDNEQVLLSDTLKSVFKKVKVKLVDGEERGNQYKIGIDAPSTMVIIRDKDNYKNSSKYKKQQAQKNRKVTRKPVPVFEKPKTYKTKNNSFDVDSWLNDNLSDQSAFVDLPKTL